MRKSMRFSKKYEKILQKSMRMSKKYEKKYEIVQKV